MAIIGSLAVSVVARTQKFQNGMNRAARSTRRFRKSTKKTSLSVAALGKAMKASAIAAAILAAAAAVFKLVRGFKNLLAAQERFNQAMRSSLAIMSDVSMVMRRDMSNAAIRVAAVTKFSAEEAAKSYFFLASAGLDAKQSIAALPLVAKFAQAGMFDMALATDLVTDAQSALGLTVKNAITNLKNMTRVSDVLVKANTLANASVQQFSEALTNKAAAALRMVNKDITEGVAVLAAFADQGLKGADAGTAFNIVMRDLQTKALQNAKAFKEASIAVFDQAGKMNNLADIISDVEDKLQGMSDAQKKTTLLQLGFTDKSVIFISTLIGMSDRIRGYEESLRSAGGATEDVANKQLTPMAKALAKLGAAWTKIGTLFGPIIEKLAFLTDKFATGLSTAAGAMRRIFGFENEIKETANAVQTLDDKLGPVVKKNIDFAESMDAAAEASDKLVEGTEKITEAMKAKTKAYEEDAKRTADIYEDMKRKGEAVFEATRTPFEKSTAEMMELQRLLNGGAITENTFDRAIKKVKDGLKAAGAEMVMKLPGALVQGSAAASSFINRATARGRGVDGLNKTADKQLTALQRIDDGIAKVGAALAGGEVSVEVAF